MRVWDSSETHQHCSFSLCAFSSPLLVQLLSWARESPPDPKKPLDTYYDCSSGHLAAYTFQRPDGLTLEQLSHTHTLPVIETPDMQRGLQCFSPWLTTQHRQPFMVVGPEGCGKG